MEISVNGISQIKAIKMDLDCSDILILSYIRKLRESDEEEYKIEIENESYYLIKYENVLNEYPILKIKKDTLYRKMKVLANKGILTHKTVKEGGIYAYYGVTHKFYELLVYTR